MRYNGNVLELTQRLQQAGIQTKSDGQSRIVAVQDGNTQGIRLDDGTWFLVLEGAPEPLAPAGRESEVAEAVMRVLSLDLPAKF